MSLHLALAVAALAASILLFAGGATRILGAVALAAAGVEVAMAFGLVHFAVAGLPLGLLLGLCLAVPGLLAWLRTSSKAGVTAATVTALVGLLQVLAAVGRRL